MRVVFYVPGRPVPKARPRVTKKGYAYTPRKTMAFEQSVVLAYRKSKAAGEPFPEGVPLLMELTFTFSPPKSWSKARREEVIRRGMCPTCRPDLDNLMKGVADALNGVAYKDDGQIAGAVIRKQYGRKDNTRVIIETMEQPEGQGRGRRHDGRSIRSTQAVDAAGRGEDADFYSVQPHRRTENDCNSSGHQRNG